MTVDKMNDAYNRAAKFEMWSGRLALGIKKSISMADGIALNAVINPVWIDDTAFVYQRSLRDGSEFRLVDAQEKTNKPAFNHQALAASLMEKTGEAIEAANLPITRLSLRRRPFTAEFDAYEKRWAFDGEAIKEVAEIAPAWVVSPDGSKAAFVRDFNIWVRNIESGEERRLTQDGTADFIYAAQTALWGNNSKPTKQMIWSPDSARLLTAQRDTRQLRKLPLIDYAPIEGGPPIGKDYVTALPGDEHTETYRIVAIDVASGRVTPARYPHIPACRSGYGIEGDRTAWWAADGRQAYFVDVERGECAARVVAFNVESGETRIVFEETGDSYLALSVSEITPAYLHALPDTDEVLWLSARDGWTHLYLYDLKTGEMTRQVTKGDYMVYGVLHVDVQRREVLIQTAGRISGRNPYYSDICRVNIDTGVLEPVREEDADLLVTAKASFNSLIAGMIGPAFLGSASGASPRGDFIVVTQGRVDAPPTSFLLSREGETVMDVEHCDVSALPERWHWPEPVQMKAADGDTDIYGTIFRPSNFDPEASYPVIDISFVHGEVLSAPTASFEAAPLGGVWFYHACALAELGFIVVGIDGRGTVGREESFTKAGYGRVASYNHTKDRIGGLRQLAQRYPYMDLDRVGVVGFNGNVAPVYCLLEHGEFYKVGAAMCLQDPRYMATPWSDRYEFGGRDVHPHAEDLVGNLNGKLLLIHGLKDACDPAAATLRLAHALQKANKDFDMILMPNESVGDHIASGYANRRMWDYLVTHLLGQTPPKEFRLNKPNDEYMDLHQEI